MRRGVILGLLLAVGAGGLAVAAQQAQQPQPLTIEKVKDNLFVIMGGGGNTAAFVIAKGVVLVDTKLANYGQPILDKVKSVTDKPITHIINTHTHGDHVGSNEFFPASVEIVAQENTAANMVKMPIFQDAAKKHGLADRTFKDKLTLLAGNEVDRSVLLRTRAHQRRCVRRVSRSAGDARRRRVLRADDADHGCEQRRQRRRVSRHAREGCGGHQERRRRDSGPQRGHQLAGVPRLRRVHEVVGVVGAGVGEGRQDAPSRR